MNRIGYAVIVVLALGPIIVLGAAAGLLSLTLLAGVPLYRRTLLVRLPAAERTLPLYLAALGWQVVHCAEEWSFGLAARIPALFGCPAWSDATFLWFNAVYYLLFATAIAGFVRRAAWLAAAACPFVVATLVGGPAHSVMALSVGGYFPGLMSAWIGSALALLLIRQWRRCARDGATH